MTLGFQITLRGVCYLITEGKPIGNLPENLLFLGLESIAGIPVPIFFLAGTFVVVGIITFKNIFWTIRICGWWQLSGCASFGN